jgi:PKD repeat protein
MKKILNILIFLFAFANAQAQTACCPEFSLAFKRDFDCTKFGSCVQGAISTVPFTASMCKYSTNSFLVTPNLPGYTYNWIITGGTPASSTTNPTTITWGGGSNATIIVTITSADGSCVKTIKENICLRDAPVANFTFTPNGACAGTLITFTNTSTGGAGVSWDFGDGSFAGNVNSPTHTYAAPGTYNVTIFVTNDTTPCISTSPGQGDRPCCGCTSSFTQQVTVMAGSPLLIVPKKCINQCLCAGDTAEYCLTTTCAGPITWTVSAGSTILSGQGTQCVRVIWGNTYPTTISVSAPNCGNPCGNTATLSVPVLVNNIPIMPNTSPVCQGSTQTYSLPAMPGVFYNWTVSGGSIIGPNVNTPIITVLWGPGPTGVVSCSYNNPLKQNCSGSSTLNISIKPVLKISGPAQSCVGCTAVFASLSGPVTWSGSAGLIFTPPAGTSTTVSFPASLTTNTYTVTATGAPGTYCNSPVSAFIVVAPKPVLTITPSTASACPGTIIKFVATSTVTTSPISWVLPTGATMVANTGTQLDTAVIKFGIIPVAGVTVTATQNCAFNLTCSQGTAIATVNRPPIPILSAPLTTPCIDQTVVYSITNYNPLINYTWTITNNLGTIVSGQGSGSITVLWHGNLISGNAGVLTVSNCSGSASTPITVSLPVYPTITVGGTCIKTGMTLTSSPAGSYAWTGPGIVGSSTTQTININQPGQYCVTINGAAPGSCGQKKCITIAPNPYFVKIIPPCSVSSCNPNSLSVLLTVATNIPSPVLCQWLRQPPGGGPFTVVSTSCGNYTATLLGNYYLVITDPNGCKDTSNIIRIPQDINICCVQPICLLLVTTQFNFTFSGCQPTSFVGTPITLPPGWTTGTIHPVICYGDGTSDDFVSLNTTHQYAAAGSYTVCVIQKVVRPATNDTCCIQNCKQVVIPVVTKFTAAYNCNTGLLTMTDGSSYYPSSSGSSYSWSISGGTYTGILTNAPNQSVTPTSSGTFVITLIITKNGCMSTYSIPVLVVLPVAPININPNPTCDGSPVFFSTTAGMASYNWQFGDNSFSLMATPQHIYSGPGTYTVTLTVVTPDGCTIIKTATVTVQPKPKVTIAPNLSNICPGFSQLLTATMVPNGNTMCPNIGSYTIQWYNNGIPIGLPIAPSTYNATTYGSYYAVLTSTSTGCNCKVTSDTVTVNMYPKPIAKIKGKSTVCLSFGTGTVSLSNSVATYPGYLWSSNSPGNISFDFNNIYNPNVTITSAGNYQVFLMVTDINGCKAYDTLCIYAVNSPTVTISSPGGVLCSGKQYTLTAVPAPPTAPPAGYGYLWSNNATTSSVTVSAPGVYSVTLTDRNTGCSALSNPVFINQGPYLKLFPSCCDTICNNKPINIIPPLPLGPGQTVCTLYNIVWLDNNVPISPQPSPCNILNTSTLTPGSHSISIAVTLNGCTDTSNVFNLFIKNCTCNCDSSHWGNIFMNNGLALACGNVYNLTCNQPYTINATYNCKDTACKSAVTYSLLLPDNTTQTGTIPFSFTPSLNGVYVLTMYGWCGGKICDSCKIKFLVNCVPVCDCTGSVWGTKTYTIENITQPITCMHTGDHPIDVKCKKPITINANYICATATCAGSVTYQLVQPSGTTTGSVPFTFTPGQTGIYTVTLYGWCGTKLCDSCVIVFHTDCPVDTACCPYNITVKDSLIQTYPITNPDATVANTTFSLTGPSGNIFTELRANVVSYSLTDNYNRECLNCKSLPYSWASIYKAGNVGVILPKITMFGGTTVHPFNPSGSGMYQNPREVIWSNNSPFALPNNLNIQFLLPPASIIDCCELTAKICVKFTFRDINCKECEVIVCFTVIIKPGGGNTNVCNCKIAPLLQYEGGSRAVNCGETVTLFQGNIPVSMLPNFSCKDSTGKDCASVAPTVTISKNGGPAVLLTGPLFNFTFLSPGIYEYNIVGLCAGKKCECIFKVNIP